MAKIHPEIWRSFLGQLKIINSSSGLQHPYSSGLRHRSMPSYPPFGADDGQLGLGCEVTQQQDVNQRKLCFGVNIDSYTSSTALGGGGSFKNRKPIGEVSWSDAWMAERNSTDGPKGGWSCVFWSSCNGCSGHLTHNCWM